MRRQGLEPRTQWTRVTVPLVMCAERSCWSVMVLVGLDHVPSGVVQVDDVEERARSGCSLRSTAARSTAARSTVSEPAGRRPPSVFRDRRFLVREGPVGH